MGCDIHSGIEVRETNGPYIGKWVPGIDFGADGSETDGEPAFAPVEERHYTLFGLMAGVRDKDQTPLVEPRGLPEDISPWMKKWSDDWGAHSHSWLSLAELEAWEDRLFGELLEVALPVMRAIQSRKVVSSEDVRLVFFFDS